MNRHFADDLDMLDMDECEARQRRIAMRFLIGIAVASVLAFVLVLAAGCVNPARRGNSDEAVATAQRADAAQSSLAWARQWELLASAAEAPTAAEEHARVLDALEHAAAMRDGQHEVRVADAPRPVYADKPDPLALTIGRAADALAELAEKK